MRRKHKILIKRVLQFLIEPFRTFLLNRIYTIRSGPAKGLKRKGGFGFYLFLRIRRRRPQLFIEMHAISDDHAEVDAKNVIELLDRYDYKIYNIRQKRYINKANYHLTKSDHLFCS